MQNPKQPVTQNPADRKPNNPEIPTQERKIFPDNGEPLPPRPEADQPTGENTLYTK